MTLGKGDVLVKVVQKTYNGRLSGSTLANRIREWVEVRGSEPSSRSPDYLIPDRELAELLTGPENYAVYEVMDSVHYESHKDGFTFVPDVNLKVVY